MTAISKPLFAYFRLPQIRWTRPLRISRRHKRTTIDLLTSSPYLQRDIGLMDTHCIRRKP
ncbi:hypothetical protein VW29_01645 [Devosia limi DSM 17137]|uniref:Uncharacterized protein n=1 Tax=Devosia limi DSM 17137 TaxID=1121477 RepID=A0A0F5LY62_9HYPH|nr:hypothetical protein VW29_01645 [Devosia limi DSM 17137]SHE53108.1 hypothetical protein SAMN02745223_00651 [Devosia limi DSM 17137]